jgi:hypothetical protein
MSKLKELEPSLLPAAIVNNVTKHNDLVKKLAAVAEHKAKLNAIEATLNKELEENSKVFFDLHKDHGDFTVGGLNCKKSVSYRVKVLDETKLPESCFKTKKEVSLTAVKDLIIAGQIPKEIAFQEKNEKISLK